MNQKNYQYLAEGTNLLGFGDKLNGALKTKMELNFETFELKANGMFEKDRMDYALTFEKGKGREDGGEQFYFLNKIKATITKEDGQSQAHEFRLYNQRGFNTKEMFNLMDGRPVYKTFKKRDGEITGQWTRLDFASRDENGNAMERKYYDNQINFSLAKEVSKLNLLFANREEKEQMLKDLQSGDLVEVSIKKDGRMEKAYVGVPLQLGGVRMYNADMKEIRRTDSNNINLVAEDQSVKTGIPKEKTAEQGQSEKLPDSTKKLIEKAEKAQGQDQQIKRRA